MAVIDTFLKLMVHQKADTLIVTSNDVPVLLKMDETIRLSMPAVPADMVSRIAGEVIGGEHSGEQAGGQPLNGSYQSADGDQFIYEVSARGEDCRIEMRPMGQERVSREAGADGPGQEPDRAGPNPQPEESPAGRPDIKTEPPKAGTPPARNDTPGEPPTPDPTPRQPDPVILALVSKAIDAGASDIFLSSGKAARMRLDGAIQSLENSVTSDKQIRQLVPPGKRVAELETSGHVDFASRWVTSGTSHRLRINVFHHAEGLAAALRPIRARIPSLDELHLPADLSELCAYSSGLVLVTGASGSGKSTTLAALVEHINQTKARHIITIEDPIEFEHENFQSLIHQREVGAHVDGFSSGLRAALRENPDVILLGEMRDLATIASALTAAETGHLVLSTLHTGNASAAVNRIIDVFPGHQQAHVRMQLASSLRAVVAQRLVPSARHGGRLPAIEKLIVNHAVAIQIREGREHQVGSAIQTGADEGMITLERSLSNLVTSGKVSRSTAFLHAEDHQALHKLIG